MFNFAVAVVAGVVALLVARLQLRQRERLVEEPDANMFIPRAYTLAEVAAYDGKTKPYAFVGVKGVVYNAALQWYGAEGPYNAFAGRDSSRQLGKMKVGREEENADWTRMTPSHMDVLNDWEDKLRAKYPAVGWIVDDPAVLEKRAEAFEP